MVDRVYKGALPEFRRELEHLRKEFGRLKTSTNWTKLRLEPLLKHVKQLEKVISSREHSRAFSRLRRGVDSFHSDLVYLKTNISSLKRVLEAERRSLGKRPPKSG
jgi:uncharacterized coiled-coil DUF342 family protein